MCHDDIRTIAPEENNPPLRFGLGIGLGLGLFYGWGQFLPGAFVLELVMTYDVNQHLISLRLTA